jgi:SAM-dependent methyltransferase
MLEVENARYGRGVLSEGEIITSSEQDRLVAKRAWLQLWDHFMRHDERLKALQLQVPWDLETDPDVKRRVRTSLEHLEPFIRASRDPKRLKEYLIWDESEHNTPDTLESIFAHAKKDPRIQWIMNQIITLDPSTLLDVGVGFGEVTIEMARLQSIAITAIAPFAEGCNHAKQLQEEGGLAINWVHDVWEALREDFLAGKTRYDVVVASEILEHVIQDRAFVEDMCQMARRSVIITTPFGSVNKGFQLKDPLWGRGQHVRAYGVESLERLLSNLDGFEARVDTLPKRDRPDWTLPTLDNTTFCIHLRRVDSPVAEVKEKVYDARQSS